MTMMAAPPCANSSEYCATQLVLHVNRADKHAVSANGACTSSAALFQE